MTRPLPTRALPPAQDSTAEQVRRETKSAIDDMRREIELLKKRVYALENP